MQACRPGTTASCSIANGPANSQDLMCRLPLVSMIKDHRQHYSPRPRVLKQPLEAGEFCLRGPRLSQHRSVIGMLSLAYLGNTSHPFYPVRLSEFGWNHVSDMTPFLKLR